jgi:dihydroxyacetone kinase
LSALRECALAATSALEAARDELGRLDSAAGDGDHGMTMAAAARAARSSLEAAPDAEGADLLTRLALAAGSVGGASGPLYASGLLAMATSLRSDPDAEPWALAQAAEGAIASLGRAKPGDKTILDALHPAVVALRETGDLRAAAEAARAGAEATAGMVAAAGRARVLGERSRGTADPGATSLAVILEAAASAYPGRRPR